MLIEYLNGNRKIIPGMRKTRGMVVDPLTEEESGSHAETAA